MRQADFERFLSKTQRLENGCLIWTGGLGRGGYGKYKAEGRTAAAHTWAWEHVHGPVPEGMDLHHDCRNRKCVEESHLLCILHEEHQSLHAQEITHCKRGHPYTEENTLWRQKEGEAPYRSCRKCNRERAKRWYYDNHEKAIAIASAWQKAHPEANCARVKRYYRQNPELFKARAKVYRERKKALEQAQGQGVGG